MMNIQLRKEVLQNTFLDPRHRFKTKTQTLEVRYDPLTGRTVHIAHLGAIAPLPLNLAALDQEELRTRCPFCPGRREQVTPKFPPDLIPAGHLRRGEALVVPNIAPYDSISAVTVVTGQHLVPLDHFTARHLVDALGVSLEFLQTVRQKRPELPYALLGWNYMPPSGGGLVHPHVQAVATRFPGNRYRDELAAAQAYTQATGRNYWPDLAQAEKSNQERYIGCTGQGHWLSAFAPLGTIGEILGIYTDVFVLDDVDAAVLEETANAFLRLFAFFQAWGAGSFNAVLGFGPANDPVMPAYWRIIPRTYLNASEKPADTNFFQMLLHEPVSSVIPEELCAAVRPFFG